MELHNIREYYQGWFVGDFMPSAHKTDQFEVCFKEHREGEKWPRHYHKVATEINYLIRGVMKVQGTTLFPGDVFIIRPMEVADPEFLDNCELMVVKVPSIPGDKYDI